MNYLSLKKFQLAKIFVEKLLQYEFKVIKYLATSKSRSWQVLSNQELMKGYNGAICHGLANWGYSDSPPYYYRAMTLLRREGALGSCCCSVTKTYPTLCDPMDCSRPGSPKTWGSHLELFQSIVLKDCSAFN